MPRIKNVKNAFFTKIIKKTFKNVNKNVDEKLCFRIGYVE